MTDIARVRRKSVIVKDKRGALGTGEESGPPVIDYAAMSRDELVDHFIDENGLVAFLDVQQRGIPYADWNWKRITLDLMAFSHYLQFSPAYLKDLYEMQKGRQA